MGAKKWDWQQIFDLRDAGRTWQQIAAEIGAPSWRSLSNDASRRRRDLKRRTHDWAAIERDLSDGRTLAEVCARNNITRSCLATGMYRRRRAGKSAATRGPLRAKSERELYLGL